MIPVTKPYLPPLNEYICYLEQIWESGWLTNNGHMVQELEQNIKQFLDIPYVNYVTNGTIALQIALKALNITKEIITTPFSYVATTTSILWEDCKPVFVDIEKDTFCIDANQIEEAITENTEAILATHVYGYPCDVVKIKSIADKYGLKVIYDGAHAFGTNLRGRSLLSYGDISTVSFHATKLFHTIEGGAIITNDKDIAKKVSLLRSFGHIEDDYYSIGINGKNSEFHAAMGLCLFPKIFDFITHRKKVSELYDSYFGDMHLQLPKRPKDIEYNYSYYPVVFLSEEEMLNIKSSLYNHGFIARRYFYPSLNQLPYYTGKKCLVSEDIASRVLCLPLYYGLGEGDVQKICKLIREEI